MSQSSLKLSRRSEVTAGLTGSAKNAKPNNKNEKVVAEHEKNCTGEGPEEEAE